MKIDDKHKPAFPAAETNFLGLTKREFAAIRFAEALLSNPAVLRRDMEDDDSWDYSPEVIVDAAKHLPATVVAHVYVPKTGWTSG